VLPTSSFLQVGGSDRIAESVPDAQHAHVLPVLPDMKDDSMTAPPFAVQQVPGRENQALLLRK